MKNDQKIILPAVDGFFTMEEEPHLIGGRFKKTGAFCFPRDLGGSDPTFENDEIEEVLLGRFGKIWSYTNSVYPPPPPFIPQDPYVPVVVAAVELEKEKIVILGQIAAGFTVGDLTLGMEVELTLGTLYEDENHRYVTWNWKPTT